MNIRQGNRIVGVKRTFATAKQVQAITEQEVVITLPSAGGSYAWQARKLSRDGQVQPTRLATSEAGFASGTAQRDRED